MKPSRSLLGAQLLLLLGAWALLLFQLDTVPAGLQHDQTFNLVDAIEVLYGARPLYFPANFGREPLFIYTVAAVTKLAGGHFVWSLRFSGVGWAFLGLALMLPLGRRFLPPRTALLSVALVAGSFWFLFTARVGLRAITLFPLVCGMGYFLALALHRPRWHRWGIAGLFGGVAIYSYLAARVLFALPSLLLVGMLLQRRRHRRVALGLLLTLACMGAVAFPLYRYSQTHPISQRVAELDLPLRAARGGDLGPLLGTGLSSLHSLVIGGQDQPPFHYNLPGRPALSPVLAVALLLGLLLTLRHPTEPRNQLLLTALALGLLPDMVTGGGPLYLRAIIALPFLFILVARGVEGVVSRLAPRSLVAALLGLLLLFHYSASLRDYFVRWATAPESQRIYNADLRQAAAFPTPGLGARHFLSSDFWMDLDPQTYGMYEPKNPTPDWFNLALGLPYAPTVQTTLLVTASTPPVSPRLTDALRALGVPLLLDSSGLVQGYRLTPDTTRQLPYTLGIQPLVEKIRYGEAITLHGAVAARDGAAIEVLTHWRVEAPASEGVHLAVSLSDAQGYRWTQVDDLPAFAYQSWQPGDHLIQVTRLPVPGDLVPGTYTVQVALYHTPERPLPMQQGGRFLSVPPQVAEVVILPGAASPAPPAPIMVQVSQVGPLHPLGAWERLPRLTVDVPTTVHLSWQAKETLDTANLTFQVRGRTPAGQLLWAEPLIRSIPLPPTWPAGQVYRLAHTLQLPATLTVSSPTLRVEVCALRHNTPLGCARIGEPELIQVDRLRTLPTSPSHPLEVVWGEGIALVGYDVTQQDDHLALVLYWQVRHPLPISVKQFVHLLDEEGTIVAQEDKALAGRVLPPAAWAPGEYLIDTVRFPVPPGQPIVTIRLGLYGETDGERLPTRSATGELLADNSLLIPLGE